MSGHKSEAAVASGVSNNTFVGLEINRMENNVVRLPQFTLGAKKNWMTIPLNIRNQLIANVYCGECRGETTIINYSGSVKSGRVILSGQCKTCGADVTRVID